MLTGAEIVIQSKRMSDFMCSKRMVKKPAGSRDCCKSAPIPVSSAYPRRPADLFVAHINRREINVLGGIKLAVDFIPDFVKSSFSRIVVIGIGKLAIDSMNHRLSTMIGFNIERHSTEAVVFHLIGVKFADFFDQCVQFTFNVVHWLTSSGQKVD